MQDGHFENIDSSGNMLAIDDSATDAGLWFALHFIHHECHNIPVLLGSSITFKLYPNVGSWRTDAGVVTVGDLQSLRTCIQKAGRVQHTSGPSQLHECHKLLQALHPEVAIDL